MGDLHFVHPALNSSILETGCWHFDNNRIGKFDDDRLEHGGLPQVLPLTVHLDLFGWTSRGNNSKQFLIFEFCCGAHRDISLCMGPLLHVKKLGVVLVVVTYSILESAPVPFGFRSYWGWAWGVWGLRVWGQGLTKIVLMFMIR